MRFISHLDLRRTFIRALRRAGMPVVYSQGFNPQPKLSFAAPLAVGMEGKNEYLDLYLREPRSAQKIKDSFNRQLPPGLNIKKITTIESGCPPVSSALAAALYVAELPAVYPVLQQALAGILQKERLIKLRQEGEKSKEMDIRPFIYELKIKTCEGKSELLMLLAAGSKGGVRPQEILELLPLEGDLKVYRQDLFLGKGSSLKTPEGLEPEYYFSHNKRYYL